MNKTYLVSKPNEATKVLVSEEWLLLLLGIQSKRWVDETLSEFRTNEVRVNNFAVSRGPQGWEQNGQ